MTSEWDGEREREWEQKNVLFYTAKMEGGKKNFTPCEKKRKEKKFSTLKQWREKEIPFSYFLFGAVVERKGNGVNDVKLKLYLFFFFGVSSPLWPPYSIPTPLACWAVWKMNYSIFFFLHETFSLHHWKLHDRRQHERERERVSEKKNLKKKNGKEIDEDVKVQSCRKK